MKDIYFGKPGPGRPTLLKDMKLVMKTTKDILYQDYKHNLKILEEMSEEYEELNSIGYLQLKMIALQASIIKLKTVNELIKGD